MMSSAICTRRPPLAAAVAACPFAFDREVVAHTPQPPWAEPRIRNPPKALAPELSLEQNPVPDPPHTHTHYCIPKPGLAYPVLTIHVLLKALDLAPGAVAHLCALVHKANGDIQGGDGLAVSG